MAMNQSNHQPDSNTRRPWRPRFGLGALMLFMLVACVTAAAASYLVRAVRSGTSYKAVFIIFALAAPMLLMTLLSLGRLVLTWLDRHARRRS